MKISFRLIALVLLCVFVFSLVACENDTPNEGETQSPTTAENVQETETPTEEPTQVVIDYDNLVVDAVYKELTDPFDSNVCYYHIPKINLADGIADEINQIMLDDGEAFMADAYDSIDMDVSIISSGYNYVWGYKDNIVSVVTGKFYNTPGLGYTVYNLSMDTGEILDNADLREFYNFSEEELTELIISKAGDKFEEKYADIKEQVGDFYNMQYEKTVTEENANDIKLYINEDGDLCCVATIYSLAGAEAYQHLLNLTGNSEPQEPKIME